MIVASACAGSSDIVATVNGIDINRAAVEELAPQRAGARPSEFTQYLAVRIQWVALTQAALSDFGIDPSDDEISQRLDELVAGQGAGATLEQYLVRTEASETGIREFTKQLIIQDAVADALRIALGPASEQEVSQELIDFPLDWTVVCTSHILVATEEDAQAVSDRLASGESFTDIAAEVSIDAESGGGGGVLGCGSPAEFVDPLADEVMLAAVDVPTAPIQGEFGYHIILVTQREEATLEIVRQAIEREAVSDSTEAWFVSVVDSAEVTVSEDIGTWTTDPTPQILPAA